MLMRATSQAVNNHHNCLSFPNWRCGQGWRDVYGYDAYMNVQTKSLLELEGAMEHTYLHRRLVGISWTTAVSYIEIRARLYTYLS